MVLTRRRTRVKRSDIEAMIASQRPKSSKSRPKRIQKIIDEFVLMDVIQKTKDAPDIPKEALAEIIRGSISGFNIAITDMAAAIKKGISFANFVEKFSLPEVVSKDPLEFSARICSFMDMWTAVGGKFSLNEIVAVFKKCPKLKKMIE